MARQSRPNRWRKLAIATLTLGLAGVALAGTNWRGLRMPLTLEAAAEDPAPPPLPVKTLLVEPVTSYAVSREYTGEVAAARASELGFERAGELVWLGADRGDRVAAGTVLAKLDARNLATQRRQLVARRERALAQLEELETGPRAEDIAAAEAAVRDLDDQIALDEIRRERRQYLYEEGAIPQEQFDEVAYRLDSLRDRREGAQDRLQELYNGTRAEQITAQAATVRELDAAIADLDVAIDKSSLRAPFAGVISVRHFDEGTVAEAGQAVFRLVEQQRPEIEIGLPATAIARLPAEARAIVGGRAYDARLKALLPEMDAATRTRTAVFELAAAAGETVPGEIARLEIAQQIAVDGFWLPTTALVRGDRGLWAAYAVIAENLETGSGEAYRLERRDLEVLHTAGDRVLVRGTLQGGDRIVASGTQRVVPGQIVRLGQ